MRRGLDLVYEATINFAQASLGTDIEVPALTTKKIVRVPPGTQSGTILRLRGEGIKSGAGQGGDELVQVTVRTPEMLTHNERKLIEDLAKEFEAKQLTR
jgi:molecular chaperone DnaJ